MGLIEMLRESVWKRWLFCGLMLAVVVSVTYTRCYGAPNRSTVDSGSWLGTHFGRDTIVLVRKGTAFGAFQLLAREGNTLRYAWIFREDGESVLDPNDPAVRRGEYTSSEAKDPWIEFGPFRVEWSVAAFDRTYLYYDHLPLDPVEPGGQRLCVASVASFDGVDAADNRWKYRGALREASCSGRSCP
jgi:hypothetical protein